MSSENLVLSVNGLKKTYRAKDSRKKVDALKGVSFSIKAGSVTGFLGANGAGKTTTIKCLLELAFADEGEIYYFGEKGLSSESKRKIGFLPERPYFYEYLTGLEFLRFYGELSTKLSRAALTDRIAFLLKRVGLEHARDRQLRSYSKGMLQRIGIAQALIHEPQFVILDEPQTGLDPDGRLEIRDIIRETARGGTAVFFSSHLLNDAEELCDNLVILKKGEKIYEGATHTLLERFSSDYEVRCTRNGSHETRAVANVALLQAEIDRLRASGAQITEIKLRRQTLEEAFVQLAFGREVSS